jgi:hypothetical protein
MPDVTHQEVEEWSSCYGRFPVAADGGRVHAATGLDLGRFLDVRGTITEKRFDDLY